MATVDGIALLYQKGSSATGRGHFEVAAAVFGGSLGTAFVAQADEFTNGAGDPVALS
jgi:hypothetical protein